MSSIINTNVSIKRKNKHSNLWTGTFEVTQTEHGLNINEQQALQQQQQQDQQNNNQVGVNMVSTK